MHESARSHTHNNQRAAGKYLLAGWNLFSLAVTASEDKLQT